MDQTLRPGVVANERLFCQYELASAPAPASGDRRFSVTVAEVPGGDPTISTLLRMLGTMTSQAERLHVQLSDDLDVDARLLTDGSGTWMTVSSADKFVFIKIGVPQGVPLPPAIAVNHLGAILGLLSGI